MAIWEFQEIYSGRKFIISLLCIKKIMLKKSLNMFQVAHHSYAKPVGPTMLTQSVARVLLMVAMLANWLVGCW